MIQKAHQRQRGQYFTEGNPFLFKPFQAWFKLIPQKEQETFLEPFAGANHIVRLLKEAGIENSWSCFDLHPTLKKAEGFSVKTQDTLKKFPKGFTVAITNPPYLAKNSAKRHGLAYPACDYDDVYKYALSLALENCDFIAAIVPESFIGSGELQERLHSVITLTSKMFSDTECPVCLALFVPSSLQKKKADFILWDGNTRLGSYARFHRQVEKVNEEERVQWVFNDPKGPIGLRAVDGSFGPSIRFVAGKTIPSSEIKHSSRILTRISGMPNGIKASDLIQEANVYLEHYREQTHDALLTAFKGLRHDGKYRRRLDFQTARNILDHCVQKLNLKS